MIIARQKCWFFVLLIGTILSNFCVYTKLSDYQQLTIKSEYNQEQDDQKVLIEIYDVCGLLYKNLVDIAAMYYSGMIIDTGQLYDRLMLEVGKHLFRIVRLLAWYGPAMIKNPKTSWKIKIKKTLYISSFMIVFWLWSCEIKEQKKRAQKNINSYDLLPYNNNFFDMKIDPIQPRQRPGFYL